MQANLKQRGFMLFDFIHDVRVLLALQTILDGKGKWWEGMDSGQVAVEALVVR